MKIINLLIEWIGLATVIQKKKIAYLVVHLISFKKFFKKKLKLIILLKKMQHIPKKEKKKKKKKPIYNFNQRTHIDQKPTKLHPPGSCVIKKFKI